MGSYLYGQSEDTNQVLIKEAELKISLQLIQIKLKQRLQKKEVFIKKQIETICSKLHESKQSLAFLNTETLMIEEDQANAFAILDPIVGLIIDNLKLIYETNEALENPTINSSIQTLIYSSKLIDSIEEINTCANFFKKKYGEDYLSKALINSDQLVNINVLKATEKLQKNSDEINQRLYSIAISNNIPVSSQIKINKTTIMDDCQMPENSQNVDLNLSEIQQAHNISGVTDFFPNPDLK